MRKHTIRLAILVPVVTALTLGTAGCGGQAGTTPPSTPAAPAASATPSASVSTPAATPVTSGVPGAFYVYLDAGYAGNHFAPSGFMGDTGDIVLDAASAADPNSGATALHFSYEPQGRGPNSCSYAPPCNWAGVYWLEPENNWGRDATLAGAGFDLSRFQTLKFSARAEKPITIDFKVGGVIGDYGDSLKKAQPIAAQLSTEWTDFTIDLAGADLTHIIGGFTWSLSKDTLATLGYQDIDFYLDDIRFE